MHHSHWLCARRSVKISLNTIVGLKQTNPSQWGWGSAGSSEDYFSCASSNSFTNFIHVSLERTDRSVLVLEGKAGAPKRAGQWGKCRSEKTSCVFHWGLSQDFHPNQRIAALLPLCAPVTQCPRHSRRWLLGRQTEARRIMEIQKLRWSRAGVSFWTLKNVFNDAVTFTAFKGQSICVSCVRAGQKCRICESSSDKTYHSMPGNKSTLQP